MEDYQHSTVLIAIDVTSQSYRDVLNMSHYISYNLNCSVFNTHPDHTLDQESTVCCYLAMPSSGTSIKLAADQIGVWDAVHTADAVPKGRGYPCFIGRRD